jgi:hypothetical protein
MPGNVRSRQTDMHVTPLLWLETFSLLQCR